VLYPLSHSVQTLLHPGWEEQIVRALRMYLIVVIPVAVLLVKMLIRIVSRDEFKEIVRSITNLPLELMLIAISFMLGALSGLSPDYPARFTGQSDADLFAVLVIMCVFFLSILVNGLTRFLRTLSGKLFFAFKQYRELIAQPIIPGTVPNVEVVGRILWAMVYCILMALMLLSSFAISITTLAYVLHLIQ